MKKVTDKFFHITLRTSAYLKNYKENETTNNRGRYLQSINTKRTQSSEFKKLNFLKTVKQKNGQSLNRQNREGEVVIMANKHKNDAQFHQ